MNPLVSVIMGVYNESEDFLKCSIESICNQTYRNIEVIIIDDASDRNCLDVLDSMSSRDARIKVLHNPVNYGLTKSLNIGLDNATGDYIARMDADDISVHNRIEKQVAFMEASKEVDICGSGVISFGDKVCYLSPYNGMDNEKAQCYLFFSSTLCHPSVMIRRAFLERNNLRYDESVMRGQDYDLWERSSIVGNLAVMKDVLLFYRVHKDQITTNDRQSQDLTADRVRLRRISRLGLIPTEREYCCHKLLSGGIDKSITCKDMRMWVKKLESSNNKAGLVNERSFKRMLSESFTLFKVRNRHFLSLYPVDIINLIRIAFSRMAMKQKLAAYTVNQNL